MMLAIVLHIALTRTVYGRSVIAIGRKPLPTASAQEFAWF
jgi:ribose/xylose/arabinose/galactoside ABC-type transport system permease subunit